MQKLDRAILLVLALGVWALVMKPSILTAHDDGHTHSVRISCSLSGSAFGTADDGQAEIYDFGGVTADCDGETD